MLFNSIDFLIFFPVVTLVYFAIPKRVRYIWLLVASYYFYMSWNPAYALLIAASTVVTYASGLLLGRLQDHVPREVPVEADGLQEFVPYERGGERMGLRHLVVAASFVANLGLLGFFKYASFVLDSINGALAALNVQLVAPSFDILLPVGISFYTFQALSYTMDVYRGEVRPERNILKYALFVSFFPQLVAGPIERSKQLLWQVNEVPLRKLVDYRRIVSGLILMLWGFFIKLVIADRAAVLADNVFANYEMYEATGLALGVLAFAVQIYCDFAGYSTIAIGAAKVLGFSLMENFNTPYFATSIRDFWRRWHISLSSWFRDYLYIPLGGNRKGVPRKYLNLFIVFVASGLWHGAEWSFVAWGALHGMYQIVGDCTRGLRLKALDRMRVDRGSFGYKAIQVLITFTLVCIAWVFFRADTIQDAFRYLAIFVSQPDPWVLFGGASTTLLSFGLDGLELNILVVSLMALLAVDVLKYRNGQTIDAFLLEQPLAFRWAILLLLIGFVIAFGQYGAGYDANQFIYFQF